jgi:hypothetical protein
MATNCTQTPGLQTVTQLDKAPVDQKDPGVNQVYLCTDTNGNGDRYLLEAGKTVDLTTVKKGYSTFNDLFMSAKVGALCTLKAWRDYRYSGPCEEYTQDVDDFGEAMHPSCFEVASRPITEITPVTPTTQPAPDQVRLNGTSSTYIAPNNGKLTPLGKDIKSFTLGDNAVVAFFLADLDVNVNDYLGKDIADIKGLINQNQVLIFSKDVENIYKQCGYRTPIAFMVIDRTCVCLQKIFTSLNS